MDRFNDIIGLFHQIEVIVRLRIGRTVAPLAEPAIEFIVYIETDELILVLLYISFSVFRKSPSSYIRVGCCIIIVEWVVKCRHKKQLKIILRKLLHIIIR
ncbi:hypothetical protein D3C71_1112960 [compost metagenome]